MFKKNLTLPTLFLMVSFPIVNAIIFTPALPDIAVFFDISQRTTQQMMLWFLMGYALAQLLYAPLANYFGRKPALYAGIIIQIASSLLCVIAGFFKFYPLLVIARFFLALGSGVGLKMTFTFVNEYYQPHVVRLKLSYIMLGLAVTPGISVAIGGLLNTNFGWQSCFYACIVYGILLLVLAKYLPETIKSTNKNALRRSVLIESYYLQFNNPTLVFAGLLMGFANSFVYIFATIAPFLAISLLGMSSAQYGLSNLFPPMGLAFGLICSARLSMIYESRPIIFIGLLFILFGVALLLINLSLEFSTLITLFPPMIIIYFGIGLLLPNASAIGMNLVLDKAYSAAVINFINIGVSAFLVFMLSLYTVHKFSLPIIYLVICLIMFLIFKGVKLKTYLDTGLHPEAGEVV